jgi:acyl-homoserine lactone acylase PvdQ
MQHVRWFAAVTVAAVVTAGCSPAGAPPAAGGLHYGEIRTGSARVALSVMPPGNGGFLGPTNGHLDDQRLLYEGAETAVANGTLNDANLGQFFKDIRLGRDDLHVVRTEDLTGQGWRAVIRWDDRGVPHVEGETAEDVAFAAGWAQYQERIEIMELSRTVGRAGVLEVAGGLERLIEHLDTALLTPHIAYTDADLQAQLDRWLAAVPPTEAARMSSALDAFVAGINAMAKITYSWPDVLSWLGVKQPKPWTRLDTVATAITMNDTFGYAGGDELTNAKALGTLERLLGPERGRATFDEWRRGLDNESYTTGETPVVYPAPSPVDPAAVARPDGPVELVGGVQQPKPPHASNFVIVSGSRTASGHPILVGGPQTGMVAPGLLFEMELQGGGYAAAGATFAGVGPWLMFGHSTSYAWTPTSGLSDQVDLRFEKLCEPSGAEPTAASTHYVFNGACIAMTSGDTSDPFFLRRTVHGPVIGRTTVGGRPVAISRERSSRGMEAMTNTAFWLASRGELGTAQRFVEVMREVPENFNWGYVNAQDIAWVHSGTFPILAPGVDPDLPSWGTGEWEHRGTLPTSQLPYAINPARGELLSWNNRPAPGWRSADNRWGIGDVQRVNLLADRIAGRRGLSLSDVFRVAQEAATSDLRATDVFSVMLEVLGNSPAPSPELARARDLLTGYIASGAHRRDTDGDGWYDDPTTAFADWLFVPLAAEVVGPELRPYLEGPDHQPFITDDPPKFSASAYAEPNMYSIVSRELRRVLGRLPAAPGVASMCGDLVTCRAALWRALGSAVWQARMGQLSDDLSKWRKATVNDQVRFIPFVANPNVMRFQNRPTWQLIATFG